MKKKLSRSKLVRKLDKAFSLYIRLKNSRKEIATCFTCGKRDHYKQLQNGHFMSRKYYSTRWDELNCQVQCAGCNVFRYGEQFIFGRNLDKKFGKGTADKLLRKSKKTVKISNPELEDLISHYELLIKKYLK